MKKNKEEKGSILTRVNDTNLLLTITIVVFFVMYIGAILIMGEVLPSLRDSLIFTPNINVLFRKQFSVLTQSVA